MQVEVLRDDARTEVGSYFVSNYPPFSAWRSEHVPAALRALDTPPAGHAAPLGLYIHIPFCRRRCHFCYFRVYTDKNARDVDQYTDALAHEVSLYADRAGLRGRQFDFVYFGGGTPSFLSSEQLERLVARISAHWRWDHAREVTFECEPGTLKESKLETIRAIGTTRLSLGIEHLDDEVLEINGRAHKSPEVFRACEWARKVGFDQINVDLIAGMVGDTEEKWRETVERTLALAPDSLTVYQMEVPHNTTLARESKETGRPTPVPDWATKRRWVEFAFDRFGEAGYVVSSAYTVVRPSPRSGFVYRDAVWHGADMIGTGVASFSHFAGVHYQNHDRWEDYVGAVERGDLPLSRALPLTNAQLLIREFVLQLKTGHVQTTYFERKYGVDVRERFADVLAGHEHDGYLTVTNGTIELTRAGLLRADALLPAFFEPALRGVRYT
jgi:oxygen-independent coproporphyrinogen-3 oxidase